MRNDPGQSRLQRGLNPANTPVPHMHYTTCMVGRLEEAAQLVSVYLSGQEVWGSAGTSSQSRACMGVCGSVC